MKAKPSVHPQSNRQVADQVMTPKRLYFVPDLGVSVEAEDCEEAVKSAKKLTEKEEAGDGNK